MQGEKPKDMHTGPVFRVERHTRTVADGTVIHTDIVRHPGAVLVVPVLECGKLVMIHNHRIAIGKPLLEFCAGKLEPGEDPESAAIRELEEECGYHAESCTPLGWFYTSPGFTDEKIYVFEARNLNPVARRLQPDENIDVVEHELPDVESAICDGNLCDGKSIASFYLWRARSQNEDAAK